MSFAILKSFTKVKTILNDAVYFILNYCHSLALIQNNQAQINEKFGFTRDHVLVYSNKF